MRIVVVLPAPLLPTRPKIVPGSTVRFRSWTAWMRRYDRWRWVVRMTHYGHDPPGGAGPGYYLPTEYLVNAPPA